MKPAPLDTPPSDMLAFERRVYHRGFQRVCGIDEAGRGPLAGPVVAAAVILPRDADLTDVKDSKLLSPMQREACYEAIVGCALDVGIGRIDAQEIDRINILQATFRAMIQAVQNLRSLPDYLLIDGPYELALPIVQEGIPGGDVKSLSIAAASIVAKVRRDRLMVEYHDLYPHYGFDQHKGYPTRAHCEALGRYGSCPIHRQSFRGVAGSGRGRAYDGGNAANQRKGR